MLTAHLPSGYILAKQLGKVGFGGSVLPAALVGAVFPDLDMLYFHFVDLGRTNHHMFVSHWPLAWLGLAAVVVPLAHFFGSMNLRNGFMAFFLAVMMHCVLDSVAAPMFWLMPFAEGRVELVTVPASYSRWIISYLLHWAPDLRFFDALPLRSLSADACPGNNYFQNSR